MFRLTHKHRGSSDRVFVAFAMRRSGQHAVINWICKQLDNVTHFNNCVIRRRGLHTGIEPQTGRYIVYDDEVFDTGGRASKALLHSLDDVAFTRHAFYSFENFDFRKTVTQYIETRRKVTVVIINRDPFNWVASFLRKGWAKSVQRKIGLWKQHVRESLGESQYLPAGVVHVDFGRWFADRVYRQGICDRLEIRFTDKGVNDVLSIGGGSSFDGLCYDGRAQEMNVLQRWESYRDNPVYQSVFNDSDLFSLSERYFHFNPYAGRNEGRRGTESSSALLAKNAGGPETLE